MEEAGPHVSLYADLSRLQELPKKRAEARALLCLRLYVKEERKKSVKSK